MVKSTLTACGKYVCLLLLLSAYTFAGLKASEFYYNENGDSFFDKVCKQGWIVTLLMYIMTLPVYLSVPISIINLIGIVFCNPFYQRTHSSLVSTETPFLCFRVVTRGLFPKLVQDVTDRNIDTVMSLGIHNFKFEVVTDNPVSLPASHYVREIVVPSDYKTRNGTLFKARALNYCLNSTINILSADDWIIHLDEETQLTESVVKGILDFARAPKSQIGQGVITYGQMGIQNLLTTLMDGVRTAFDFGMFRVALQLLHRPIVGFKGSFIVVKMSIEEDIGFDFGPAESIAEDLRFALTAWHKGYRFDFIEGVMQEKSTFTLSDFVKQRKRWFIGHYQIIWGNSLPLYCKFALIPMHVANLLLWVNIAQGFMPIHLAKWQLSMFFLLTSNILFMLVFGNYISLGQRQRSVCTKLCLCFLSQFVLPVMAVLEAYSALVGFWHRHTLTFDIVEKEITSEITTDTVFKAYTDKIIINM